MLNLDAADPDSIPLIPYKLSTAKCGSKTKNILNKKVDSTRLATLVTTVLLEQKRVKEKFF